MEHLGRNALILALVLTGAWLPSAAPAGEKVAIGVSPSVTSSLLIVADAMGFFADEELSVEIKVNPGGGSAIMEEMFQGKVDLSSGTGYPVVFNAFLRKDFQIVASVATTANDNMLVARHDAGIRSVTDLKGKRVGTSPTGMPRYALEILLMKNGLQSADLVMTYASADKLVAQFAADELQAICIFGTLVDQARKSQGANAVVFGDETLLRITTLLTAMEGTIRSRPATIAKVLRATIRAEQYARNNPERSMAIVAERIKMDPDLLRVQWKPTRFRVALEQSTIVDLENMARWQLRGGLARAQEVPNYLDFIHFPTLERLDPKRVSIIH